MKLRVPWKTLQRIALRHLNIKLTRRAPDLSSRSGRAGLHIHAALEAAWVAGYKAGSAAQSVDLGDRMAGAGFEVLADPTGNAGYKDHRTCRLGGIVIICRTDAQGADGDKWAVIHEPSGRLVTMATLAHARDVMKGVAKAETLDEARRHADILPHEDA